MAQVKPNAARDCAMKARVYRLLALMFVLVGILLFAYIYTTKIQGNFAEAIKDPYVITIFIVPFLPAAFLSWLASRQEEKFDKLTKTAK